MNNMPKTVRCELTAPARHSQLAVTAFSEAGKRRRLGSTVSVSLCDTCQCPTIGSSRSRVSEHKATATTALITHTHICIREGHRRKCRPVDADAGNCTPLPLSTCAHWFALWSHILFIGASFIEPIVSFALCQCCVVSFSPSPSPSLLFLSFHSLSVFDLTLRVQCSSQWLALQHTLTHAHTNDTSIGAKEWIKNGEKVECRRVPGAWCVHSWCEHRCWLYQLANCQMNWQLLRGERERERAGAYFGHNRKRRKGCHFCTVHFSYQCGCTDMLFLSGTQWGCGWFSMKSISHGAN